MHTAHPTMSSTGDIRVSLPLGLFCVATLSWGLLSALQQSLTPDPQDLPAASPTENRETKPNPAVPPQNPEAHHDLKTSHVNDGLGEDLYWEDDLA